MSTTVSYFPLVFQTVDQSVVGPDNEFEFSNDIFIGREFDESFDLGSIDISAEGRAGLQIALELDGGTVNATIPINLFLDLPNEPLQEGETFTIKSGFSFETDPSFSTVSPDAIYDLDLVFDAAADINLFGSESSFDVEETVNLANFNSTNGEFFIDENLTDFNLSIPNVDVHAVGTLPLTGSASDQYISGSIDFDAVAENLLGLPPFQDEITLIEIEMDDDVVLEYNLLDVDVSADVSLSQHFSLSDITLPAVLTLEDGTPIPFNVGEDIEVTVPADVGSSLEIDAAINLDALFSNETTLAVDPSLDIVAGEFTLEGPDNFNLSFGPLFEQNTMREVPPLELFNDTFDLGGFNEEEFSFHVEIEPSVPVNHIIGTEDDDGTNLLRGTDDNDKILGLGGDDRMRGRDGDDTLVGGDGDDRMRGDDGNDILIGGDGDDILFGNDGSDTFVLAAGEGTDTIRDFELSEGDKIGLSGGLEYGQLTFDDDKILFNGEVLAEVKGFDTSYLSSSDFVTI